MAFSFDEIKELEHHFDERYVLQVDCNEKQEAFEKRLSNDDKRIELILQKLSAVTWLTTAIAGGIVALVIKVFLGG